MKRKLISKTLQVSKLSESQKLDMFKVFSKYYENVSWEKFSKDLIEKDSVFLLLDKRSLEIKGFSTIVNITTLYKGKSIRGVFSGDTVVEKEYWGQGTLGKAFLKYLLIEKLKRPHKALYWYLISKGYKTYLLMANNFRHHYPRVERETPLKEQHLINAFSKQLYGADFDEARGVISIKSGLKDALKGEVTPITRELIEENRRIKFFAEKNPQWVEGEELACIARMSLFLPFYYQFKVLNKHLNRNIKFLNKKILLPIRKLKKGEVA